MTKVVFDINETVLDLTPLDPLFEAWFGEAGLRHAWFQRVLHTALVVTHTGRSKDMNFSDVARIALETVALQHNLTVADYQLLELGQKMRSLPAHPDALEGIQKLHRAGVRLAALTNSAQTVVDTAVENANLTQYMNHILSVDPVGKFKPAPEVYAYAQTQLDENPSNLWLVACHDWDIEGALTSGWHGAFIQRKGKVYHPDAPQPDTIQSTIADFADWYLAR